MSLADRFTEYVAELHEISDSHRLSHGKPEDLSRVLEAFQNSENFATEFGCVMRSIVLRENFRPSEMELLTLVAVAWGGAGPEDPTSQSSDVIKELRGILNKVLAQRVLGHRTDGPITISTEDSEKVHDVSSDLSKTTQKLDETSPDAQLHPRESSTKDSREGRYTAAQDSISLQRGAPAQNGKPSASGESSQEAERALPGPKFLFYQASEGRLSGQEDKSKSLDHPVTEGSGTTGETLPTPRLVPSAAEIVALGLTGIVVALLLSAGSLPVYRARVSVYLPSTTDTSAAATGSRDASLLNGELTEGVAERLLAWPHSKPILRQDLVSRGMRDLDLGGNETILYADLVTETARHVKVTHLQPRNLYEVTCDSWNAQFAATFCNELANSLDDQPSAAIASQEGTEPARIIDAASRPGSQVYPHWYLQGSAGLAIGCLLGVLVGFVKRSESKPIQEGDLGA